MRVLVTGASSGIGAAVTARVLADGGRVLALSRTAPVEHPRLRWCPVDLAADPDVGALLDGPVDAVVHAAGVQRAGRLGALSRADGALMWRLHVDVAVALVEATVGSMPDGGRIVLTGSRTAVGVPGKSQYAASKAALPALARSWAAELAPRRITVNVVAPGPTRTPMLADPGRAGVPPQEPPLGRFVDPAEVAAVTAFLLGPDGAMVTGQQWVICGGASL